MRTIARWILLSSLLVLFVFAVNTSMILAKKPFLSGDRIETIDSMKKSANNSANNREAATDANSLAVPETLQFREEQIGAGTTEVQNSDRQTLRIESQESNPTISESATAVMANPVSDATIREPDLQVFATDSSVNVFDGDLQSRLNNNMPLRYQPANLYASTSQTEWLQSRPGFRLENRGRDTRSAIKKSGFSSSFQKKTFNDGDLVQNKLLSDNLQKRNISLIDQSNRSGSLNYGYRNQGNNQNRGAASGVRSSNDVRPASSGRPSIPTDLFYSPFRR